MADDLVVVMVEATQKALGAAPSASPLTALLGRHGARLELLDLGPAGRDGPPSAMRAAAGSAAENFYRVAAPPGELKSLAEQLRTIPGVLGAYIKPGGEPPRNTMQPTGAKSATTPDFITKQGYIEAAPGGVDARFAWNQPQGAGQGVKVIDLEWAWTLAHEDFKSRPPKLLGGKMGVDRNHGTAVVGVLLGNDNRLGVRGIAHAAQVDVYAFGSSSSTDIVAASKHLKAGDVLLLEIHRPGPRYGFKGRPDQLGYIPIEWWHDDFAAIQNVVAQGIIVVEAGGNGAEDLDDARYSKPGPGFPKSWKNPFAAGSDSGAILVGAGAPPPGTHGRGHGPDRSRLPFSNHGKRLDAQGWGEEVTTCGYGDLQGGTQARWYTDTFSGTSSASPIVVGVLACIQSILKGKGLAPLTPAEARALLRKTGSPQTPAPGRPKTERIGRRPNLAALIPDALALRT